MLCTCNMIMEHHPSFWGVETCKEKKGMKLNAMIKQGWYRISRSQNKPVVTQMCKTS